MEITKGRIRQIIAEEIEALTEGEFGPHGARGTVIDRFFEKGQLGYQLADKFSNTLMIDDHSDFVAVMDAIKDGMRNWKQFVKPADPASWGGGLTEASQYEAGSAGYHIEQAIRMSKDLDELEQAMPKPIRIKYASGLGLKIEEELDIALEVMDNTIDSYKSDLFDARGDDEPEEADYDTETGEFIIGKG
jgi:hypothetical protein